MHLDKIVQGKVVKGHQVASGKAVASPYPAGSIEMQKPLFAAKGLDLSNCFNGTLNISTNARGFCIEKPDFFFKQLNWYQGAPQESFSFVACELVFAGRCFSAWLYYPHPETKTQHFQPANLVEILAPRIDGIEYGSQVKLRYSSHTLTFF